MHKQVKIFLSTSVWLVLLLGFSSISYGQHKSEVEGNHLYREAIRIANEAPAHDHGAARNAYQTAIHKLNEAHGKFDQTIRDSARDMMRGQIHERMRINKDRCIQLRNQLQGYVNQINENERKNREADAANNDARHAEHLINELNGKNPTADLDGYLALVDNIANHFEAAARHWDAYPHGENAGILRRSAQSYRDSKAQTFHGVQANRDLDTAYKLLSDLAAKSPETDLDGYLGVMNNIINHFSASARHWGAIGRHNDQKQVEAQASYYRKVKEGVFHGQTARRKHSGLANAVTSHEEYLKLIDEVIHHYRQAINYWDGAESKENAAISRENLRSVTIEKELAQARFYENKGVDAINTLGGIDRIKDVEKYLHLLKDISDSYELAEKHWLATGDSGRATSCKRKSELYLLEIRKVLDRHYAAMSNLDDDLKRFSAKDYVGKSRIHLKKEESLSKSVIAYRFLSNNRAANQAEGLSSENRGISIIYELIGNRSIIDPLNEFIDTEFIEMLLFKNPESKELDAFKTNYDNLASSTNDVLDQFSLYRYSSEFLSHLELALNEFKKAEVFYSNFSEIADLDRVRKLHIRIKKLYDDIKDSIEHHWGASVRDRLTMIKAEDGRLLAQFPSVPKENREATLDLRKRRAVLLEEKSLYLEYLDPSGYRHCSADLDSTLAEIAEIEASFLREEADALLQGGHVSEGLNAYSRLQDLSIKAIEHRLDPIDYWIEIGQRGYANAIMGAVKRDYEEYYRYAAVKVKDYCIEQSKQQKFSEELTQYLELFAGRYRKATDWLAWKINEEIKKKESGDEDVVKDGEIQILGIIALMHELEADSFFQSANTQESFDEEGYKNAYAHYLQSVLLREQVASRSDAAGWGYIAQKNKSTYQTNSKKKLAEIRDKSRALDAHTSVAFRKILAAVTADVLGADEHRENLSKGAWNELKGSQYLIDYDIFSERGNSFLKMASDALSKGNIEEHAGALSDAHYNFKEARKVLVRWERETGYNRTEADRKVAVPAYEIRTNLGNYYTKLKEQGKVYEALPYAYAAAECLDHEFRWYDFTDNERKHFCLNIKHDWLGIAWEETAHHIKSNLPEDNYERLQELRRARRYLESALEARNAGIEEFYKAGFLAPVDLSKHVARVKPLGEKIISTDNEISSLEKNQTTMLEASSIQEFYQDRALASELANDRLFAAISKQYVFPISGQKGVRLTDDTNCSLSNSPWAACVKTATKKHSSGGFFSTTLTKGTPITGFGTKSGGTPLFIDQSYKFGIYGGRLCWLNGDTSAYENVRMLVKVYEKSLLDGSAQGEPIYQEAISFPMKPCRSLWTKEGIEEEMNRNWEDHLSEGGHVYTHKGKLYLEYGLRTMVAYTGSMSDGRFYNRGDGSELIVTHQSSSSKYAFIVELKGYIDEGNKDPVTVYPEYIEPKNKEEYLETFSSMYAMDFSEKLPYQIRNLQKPSFEKQGVASSYREESKGWNTPFSNRDTGYPSALKSGSNPLTDYLNNRHKVVVEMAKKGYASQSQGGFGESSEVDFYETAKAIAEEKGDSPELRRHSILDAFVEEMGKDPLALATYVQNEIGLINATNAFGFSEGSIERSALGVFLEKQGSPWEQCALLVYLLRQAGYRALYVESPRKYLEFSVEQISRMLTAQFDGMLSTESDGSVKINFPWVTFQDPETGEWVELFPWIKNAHIEEGFDLYPLMPEGYQNALSWVRKYLENDPEIIGLVGPEGNDTAGVLFMRFVAKRLSKLGLSMEDVGATITPIKGQYASWEEFPRPNNKNDFLSNFTTYYDLRDRDDLFPKATIEVTSNQDASKKIETPVLRVCDLHNRRLYVHFTPESQDPNERRHRMHLELAPFDPTNEAHARRDAFNTTSMAGPQALDIVLNELDQSFVIKVSYEKGGDDNEFHIQKGVLAAICLNLGSVTRDMLDVLARTVNEAGGDSVEKLSATAYLTGMAYYEKLSSIREQSKRLHKVVDEPSFAAGLSKLSPEYRRGSVNIADNGTFIGTPKLYYPQVDMHYFSRMGMGNDHLRPDLHENHTSVIKDYTILFIADASSNEHQIINEFFNQKHAISTTKLLQLAHKRHVDAGKNGPGFLVFTREVFEESNANPARAKDIYFRKNFNLAKIKREAGSQWSALVDGFSLDNDGKGFASNDGGASFYTVAFMTPGNVYSADGNPNDPKHLPSYMGMGTLLLAPTRWSAMISSGTQTMNGGYGQRVAEHSFSAQNLPNIHVDYNAHHGWSLDGVQSAVDPRSLNSGWNLPETNYHASKPADNHYHVNTRGFDYSLPQANTYSEPARTVASFDQPASFGSAPSYANPFEHINPATTVKTLSYEPIYTSSSDKGTWELKPEWANYVDEIKTRFFSNQPKAPEPRWNAPAQESVPVHQGQAAPAHRTYNREEVAYQIADHGFLSPDVHLGSMPRNAAVGDPVNIATGTFYIDEVDISVPGPFELEIRRNYSSKNPLPGEFGFGWKRNIVSYLAINEDETIHAAEADGTVIVYRKTSDEAKWIILPKDNPELSNKTARGIGSTANPFNSYIAAEGEGDARIYYQHGPDGSVREYRMKSFPIASNNLERKRPYLVKWADAAGNDLSFAYGEAAASLSDYGQINRVESNTKSFLVFKYNEKGFVSEARASDGRVVKYHYSDWSGDLEMVERPDGSKVFYRYQHKVRQEGESSEVYSTHRIVREEMPEGRILENVYDDEGRVIEQRSTVGTGGELLRNASFEYLEDDASKGTRMTRARDAFGQLTEYSIYQNFIYKVIDPMGYSHKEAWYIDQDHFLDPETGTIVELSEDAPRGYPRSVMYEVDKRGLKTSYTYDERGNPVAIITEGEDLNGTGLHEAKSTYTYDPITNRVLTQKRAADGSVKETKTAYHAKELHLPLTIEEYVDGELVASKSFEYHTGMGVHGLIAKETQKGLGSASAKYTEYEYDASGFPCKQLDYADDVSGPLVTVFKYNKRGQLSTVTRMSGESTVFEHDTMGRVIKRFDYDASGTLLEEQHTEYNQNGQPIVVDGPHGAILDRITRKYDKAGRMLYESQSVRKALPGEGNLHTVTGPMMEQSGALTTIYEYDAIGNLRVAYDPNGNRSEMTYDALNRMKTRTKGGLEESFEYEPGGNVTHMSDNTGREVIQEYTTTGLLKYRKNADGTEDTWSYDLEGRPVRESSAGVVWTIDYDDLSGTVVRRCEATSTEEAYHYDYQGNIIVYIDAAGNRFEKQYDGLGRLVEESGPNGLKIRYAYEPSQNKTTQTNALGEQIITEQDGLGREVCRTVLNADGSLAQKVSSTYDPLTASVLTTISDKDQGEVWQRRYVDPQGNVIATEESLAGKIAKTIYNYDGKGNLISKLDPAGREYAYAYDAFDRLSREIRPDGSEIAYDYDLQGNLTSRHMPGDLTWSANYNTAGQRTGEVLSGGQLKTRSFGYTYANGLLKTKSDPRGLTFEYHYDAARRIEEIRAGKDRTSYAYDALGHIRRIEQSSGEDTSVVDHTYNALGLLEDEVVTLNGELAQSWHQAWDAAGNRTGLSLKNAPQNGNKGSDRSYAYDALGRMTMASNNATGKSTYQYKAYGMSVRRTPWTIQGAEKPEPNGLIGKVNSYVNGKDVLFEDRSWDIDGKLRAYTLVRKGGKKAQHTYKYNELGQLEKDIYTYPGLRVTPTYTYGYDALGVLTDVTEQGNIEGNTHWDCNLDPLHRIAQETIELEKDAKILLEGDTEGGVRQVHVSANGGGRIEAVLERLDNDTAHWKAYLSSLKIGESNSIKVTATSEEDIATDEVFNKLLEPYVVSSYDELGNLTSRHNALTGAATEYSWDTWGRLVRVVDHSRSRSWAYKYDALGRRLETQYEGEKSVVTKSYYDPEFEYLELGLGINDATIWKQYGPDSSGYYGSLNGIDGLEGVIHGKTGDSMGTINSVVGDVAAYTYHGETYFLDGNVDSYGRLTGDSWLDEESDELTDNTVFWVLKNSRFRGRRVEGNGLSNFGARYYNVETSSFLNTDPYGHDGSLNLYSYADADPVNYVDPDGRLSQPVNEPIGAQSAYAPRRSFGAIATSVLASVNSFMADSLPGVGTAKAFQEFSTGQDLLTGEKIGKFWGAAGVGASLIPGGKPALGGARRIVKTGANLLEKGMSSVKGLVKAHEIAMPSGKVYSTAFETTLKPTSYPGVSRGAHFQEANEALLRSMESNAEIARSMDTLGIKIERTSTGLAPRQSPSGWTWHHAPEPGLMQLVPKSQHAPGSIFQPTLHPKGRGGMAIWGR